MTLDERIEKAARGPMDFYQGSDRWEKADQVEKVTHRRVAEVALRAAFPELFASPPTHKIAPVEPTAQQAAAGDEAYRKASVTGTPAYVGCDGIVPAYRAMIEASP